MLVLLLPKLAVFYEDLWFFTTTCSSSTLSGLLWHCIKPMRAQYGVYLWLWQVWYHGSQVWCGIAWSRGYLWWTLNVHFKSTMYTMQWFVKLTTCLVLLASKKAQKGQKKCVVFLMIVLMPYTWLLRSLLSRSLHVSIIISHLISLFALLPTYSLILLYHGPYCIPKPLIQSAHTTYSNPFPPHSNPLTPFSHWNSAGMMLPSAPKPFWNPLR